LQSAQIADYARSPIDAGTGGYAAQNSQFWAVDPALYCFAFGLDPVVLSVAARATIHAGWLLVVRRALCASE
jgi:hypothetical protein